MTNIATVIREARCAAKLSRERLGALCRPVVSAGTIQRLEGGGAVETPTLRAIAGALGLEVALIPAEPGEGSPTPSEAPTGAA